MISTYASAASVIRNVSLQNKNANKKNIFIIFTLVTNTGCDHWDQKLTIINSGSDTIFVAVPLDGSFKKYPIKIDNGDTLWTHTRFVPPGDSTMPLSIEGMSWENTINKEVKTVH
jgi:hypothetical protein